MTLQPYRIAATGHSLNYLPEYIAREYGFFAEEGIRVDAVVPKPWDDVLTELAAGTSQAALGGIWVPSMYLGRATRYTPFAQVSARAPLAIVGREPAAAFDWSRMPGSTVLMKGSNGPSGGVFTKMLMAEHGIDPATVHFVQDLDGTMLSDLFVGGMGDYLVIDYGSAAALESRTDVHVVAPMVRVGGNVPWSVYYAQGESDPQRTAVQERFIRGLARGMEWVLANDAAGYADLLEALFPALPIAITVRLTNEFRTGGMWTTPTIDRRAYDRWQGGIADARLTSAPIPYDELVETIPHALAAGR